MERLTTFEIIGGQVHDIPVAELQDCVGMEKIIDRLAAIEDILGDEYDLDHIRELAQADREGRNLTLPKDGVAYFLTQADGEEMMIESWPIQDVLIKVGLGIESMIYSLRDVGNKIYFTREDAEEALRREKGVEVDKPEA